MEYKFTWVNNENKYVHCFNGSVHIGECLDIFGFVCPLNPASTGVYKMSTNEDLTGVYVAIITSNRITPGNYSCSKFNGAGKITKCVQYSVSTTSAPTTDMTTRKPGGWTEVCISGLAIGIFGVIIWVFDCIYVVILFKRDGCHVQCQYGKPACYRNKGCLKAMLVSGLFFVVAVMLMPQIDERCEEGWSHINRAAKALLVLGVVTLVAMIYSTIKAHLVDLLKDLHPGLVFSDISHFMRYAVKDIEQHLPNKCNEYQNANKCLIDKFLLVIPETCELVLPKTGEIRISEIKSTSSESERKQVSLEVVEQNGFQMDKGGNEDHYKVNIYKIKMDDQEYFIYAYVPKALTVIYQLSHKLPGMINVTLEKQRFQQLYQQILYAKGWINIVKLYQCKGTADVARALFDAATDNMDSANIKQKTATVDNYKRD
ncbi:uncharacterized protein LOC127835940 [Dreissena polymorpha]|uniref:uncharacterized protein LOC127835940 n=1 Tax=Dreissena polymorpha TaxID=45954 RepID=UPI0022652DF4|nr:uncharacterized protein LOC127835940 [Dreissena polymorpha]